MEEDTCPNVIDIHKPRVFAKKSHELIKVHDTFRNFKKLSTKRLRKPSEVSLTKYSLPDGDVLHSKTINSDDFLLPFIRYEKQQHSKKHKRLLEISIIEKYKIMITDLRKRLHVEFPPDDVFALTQIDEGFFKFVNGRPIHDSTSLYKSLKFMFLNQLRLRQEIGYRKDTYFNIEINNKKEQERYNLTVDRVMDQAKFFDNFISDDYQKSMSYLDMWEDLKNKLNEKNVELQNLGSEMFTIMSRLISLDHKYNILQKYGRFFYYLSPPSWRMHNREFAHSMEIEARGFDFGNSNEEDTFTVIFDKIKEECIHCVKPVLYFTQPEDITEVFETLEKQQLHHYTHVTQMAPHATILKKGLKQLRDLIAQDSAVLDNAIQDFQYLIEFYEERSNDLEAKVYEVLHGMFFDNVGSLEVLKFNMHLEFCYEKVFNEKPLNTDLQFMGRALENYFMEHTKLLEQFENSNVEEAVLQSVNMEKLKQKRIVKASREIRCFQRLQHELLIAFSPTRSKNKNLVPQNQKFSLMTRKKTVKVMKPFTEENKKSALTESEVEYLTLFTDWNEHDDPADFLERLK